jgi:hypothetical protein
VGGTIVRGTRRADASRGRLSSRAQGPLCSARHPRDGRWNGCARISANGIAAVWLPVFNHANTLNTVGGLVRWWDESAQPSDHSESLPWNLAVARGYYMLDANGS